MQATTPKDPDVQGFWSWFSTHHAELLEIVRGARAGRVTDLIDRALEANGLNLTYEVTEDSAGAELTFTPQGDIELAPFIDYFVSKAPSVPGWKFFPRVQRKTLAAALAFVSAIHGIDISDARIKLVVLEDQYHLCFIHGPLSELPEEKRLAVASTLLDHALGEDVMMEYIGELDVRRAGEGVAMGLLINQIIRDTQGPEEPTLDGPAPKAS